MKRIIVLVFCLFQLILSAQNNTSASFLDVCAGYRVHTANFYNQLNTVDSYKLNAPLQTAGIRWNEYYFAQRFNAFVGLGYSQVLPHTIFIQDTLKGKITGGIFDFNYGILFKTRSLNLHCYLGFNTGKLRMYGHELMKQKNPFFSPKIGVQPWLKFGKVALTAIVEYEYDVSKTNWKKSWFTNSNKVAVAPLRQSAITVKAGLSFSLE
jgi:hypothetical protein